MSWTGHRTGQDRGQDRVGLVRGKDRGQSTDHHFTPDQHPSPDQHSSPDPHPSPDHHSPTFTHPERQFLAKSVGGKTSSELKVLKFFIIIIYSTIQFYHMNMTLKI